MSQSNKMDASKEASYKLHSVVPFKYVAIKRKRQKETTWHAMRGRQQLGFEKAATCACNRNTKRFYEYILYYYY